MTGPDREEAIRRALRRAMYHLLRAGVEALRAVEAVLEELGRRDGPDDDQEGPQHIPVE